MVKRLVDVGISAILLVFALPFLLPAALLILLTSPGPVLFRQKRMGRNNQPFEILKLRTMLHGVEGNAYTLDDDDPRITRVGRVLRRSKLDELPQLWNVIRGDMSLVGPRPVKPELTYEFYEFYIDLLRVRPGLTDPASLKYSQETQFLKQAEDPFDFFKSVVTPDKIRISLEYMKHGTVWTDLTLMATTAAVCCFPSLSRRFGSLPAIPTPACPKPQVASLQKMRSPVALLPRLAASATDGVAFSYEHAVSEAEMEERTYEENSPWIRLPNSDFEPRSVPVAADGGISRL